MFHFDEFGPDTPHLPERGLGALSQIAASAILHVAVALTIALVLEPATTPESGIRQAHPMTKQQSLDAPRIVFLATDPRPVGSGGGGGGNQRAASIRRAEGIGSDAITLRVRKSPPALAAAATTVPRAVQEEGSPLPFVMLDAQPLASGSFEQIGLPTGGVSDGTSTGPGSGGGVGTGLGTGIGPGRGPGVGPGSGGGTGGGVFRPGGAVTAPRLIREVKPTYTEDAVAHRIQGTVVLEVVVTRDGRPSQIRVVRSLDPEGLDEEAIAAVTQWRFDPGRLSGTPVDVLVTIMLDFWIR